jgi:tetratricopeptide (TPR) repeat protein
VHRRGFIILFGTRNVVSPDAAAGRPPRDVACPRCGRTGTLGGRQVRPWFTLFLLPVFPLGSGRRFTQCGQCKASFATAPQEFARAAAHSDARQSQRGIALYNSMRASPGNSVTLDELMNLYLSIGEARQATAAGAEFPAAVDANEQCMTTLGRAHLASGNPAEAIRWLERALARNPQLGEAHFQQARAYLAATPPDVDRAVTAARTARWAEHPEAEALLRRAESLARAG